MKSRILFISTILIVCSISVFTQTKKIEVDISVTVKDAQIEKEIKSYLARELRSLGDVEVVEVGDYSVKVIALKIVARDNYEVGYAISYQMTHNIICQGEVYLDVLDNGLRITDTDGLRKSWEFIITSFDTRVFDKIRKAKK